jgi:hypothetical protein
VCTLAVGQCVLFCRAQISSAFRCPSFEVKFSTFVFHTIAFCVVLCIVFVLFYVLFLCCSMYCFCVVLCIVLCCSVYCFCVVLCIFFLLFYVLFLCCSIYCFLCCSILLHSKVTINAKYFMKHQLKT